MVYLDSTDLVYLLYIFFLLQFSFVGGHWTSSEKERYSENILEVSRKRSITKCNLNKVSEQSVFVMNIFPEICF